MESHHWVVTVVSKILRQILKVVSKSLRRNSIFILKVFLTQYSYTIFPITNGKNTVTIEQHHLNQVIKINMISNTTYGHHVPHDMMHRKGTKLHVQYSV